MNDSFIRIGGRVFQAQARRMRCGLSKNLNPKSFKLVNHMKIVSGQACDGSDLETHSESGVRSIIKGPTIHDSRPLRRNDGIFGIVPEEGDIKGGIHKNFLMASIPFLATSSGG